ncbi:hypothetical protein J5N97_020267 [Dioscorea zingiberensis]|uniref:Uncharacterized protein n=1 Tax=Dioscorea zingiberensis TaxID=325984 RepID=A0A9D5CGR3_9LILI|nr:hypothetical protein J5N97_020267 [Dioscorea zingiberensis]
MPIDGHSKTSREDMIDGVPSVHPDLHIVDNGSLPIGEGGRGTKMGGLLKPSDVLLGPGLDGENAQTGWRFGTHRQMRHHSRGRRSSLPPHQEAKVVAMRDPLLHSNTVTYLHHRTRLRRENHRYSGTLSFSGEAKRRWQSGIVIRERPLTQQSEEAYPVLDYRLKEKPGSLGSRLQRIFSIVYGEEVEGMNDVTRNQNKEGTSDRLEAVEREKTIHVTPQMNESDVNGQLGEDPEEIDFEESISQFRAM